MRKLCHRQPHWILLTVLQMPQAIMGAAQVLGHTVPQVNREPVHQCPRFTGAPGEPVPQVNQCTMWTSALVPPGEPVHHVNSALVLQGVPVHHVNQCPSAPGEPVHQVNQCPRRTSAPGEPSTHTLYMKATLTMPLVTRDPCTMQNVLVLGHNIPNHCTFRFKVKVKVKVKVYCFAPKGHSTYM